MFSTIIRYGFLLCCLLLLSFPGAAQDEAPVYASAYTGVVESIEGTTLVVSGLLVDGSTLPAATFVEIEVGAMITFSGTLQQGILIATNATPVSGDTTAAGSISFTGSIEAVDGTSISVNGLVVDVSTVSAQTYVELQVGVLVTVVGTYENGLVTVVTIIVVDVPPEVTPEATPETTPEPEQTQEPDDSSDIYIVIEGPVEVVVNNIIIIYGFEIELDEDDPILTVIQIGDVIRVEGVDTGTIIIANVIVIVNVNVYILDGEAWRDDSCQNPPPDWAPDEEWRQRCESGDDDDNDDDDGGDSSASDRVTICHMTGNGRGRTITVDRSAWENGHRQHGDTLGSCE